MTDEQPTHNLQTGERIGVWTRPKDDQVYLFGFGRFLGDANVNGVMFPAVAFDMEPGKEGDHAAPLGRPSQLVRRRVLRRIQPHPGVRMGRRQALHRNRRRHAARPRTGKGNPRVLA